MYVKFQPSGSNSFLDMRGSQMYSRGCCAPYTPPGGKKSYPKSVLDPIYMCVKSQISSSISFRDMRGPAFTLWGAAPLGRPLAKHFHTPK